MKSQKYYFLSLVLVIITLSGCQQFSQKKTEYIGRWRPDYRSSTVLPPLKIPANVNHPAVTESYPLPLQIPAPGSVSAVSLVPPGFGQLS
ncbi:MAG: hypothetical protein ACHQJ6_03835 [Candidatus Berkiellales bacterium]